MSFIMVRDVTKALSLTPLWSFALEVYPDNKSALLDWQNSHHAHVNDLIALAYCRQYGVALPSQWWLNPIVIRTRKLVNRARSIRRAASLRLTSDALHFELMLEGIDLQLLQGLFITKPSQRCEIEYEHHLGLSEGALSCIVNSLLTPKPE